ncbi:MAG: DUF4340 domain-containing protein [Nostocaceae cyanobacterium]|nr:DUF4340 domain-containing protein [Nostocaceae cyanobacterium]
MKLQRSTLILLLSALLLGGFVYFYEFYWKNRQEEVKQKQQQFFSFAADDVQSLKITNKNFTIHLERNKNADKPKWMMTSPEKTPASDPSVSYLMDLLVQGKRDSTVSVPANQLAEFGLKPPQATINLTLKNQKTHQLIVGNPNFNGSFVYAQIDPAAKLEGNVNVLLVSKDFQNAVNRSLSEWKQPETKSEEKPSPSSKKPTPAKNK